MVGRVSTNCVAMYGSLATGVPTVAGSDTHSSAMTPAAPAVNCARRRHDGSASSNAEQHHGHVCVAIARPNRVPAAPARRPDSSGPARSMTASAPRENRKQKGSAWPCTLLIRMGSGLQAYWNLRSAARSPAAPAGAADQHDHPEVGQDRRDPGDDQPGDVQVHIRPVGSGKHEGIDGQGAPPVLPGVQDGVLVMQDVQARGLEVIRERSYG